MAAPPPQPPARTATARPATGAAAALPRPPAMAVPPSAATAAGAPPPARAPTSAARAPAAPTAPAAASTMAVAPLAAAERPRPSTGPAPVSANRGSAMAPPSSATSSSRAPASTALSTASVAAAPAAAAAGAATVVASAASRFADVPPVPEWTRQPAHRGFVRAAAAATVATLDASGATPSCKARPIGELPLAVQEQALVDDLVSVPAQRPLHRCGRGRPTHAAAPLEPFFGARCTAEPHGRHDRPVCAAGRARRSVRHRLGPQRGPVAQPTPAAALSAHPGAHQRRPVH